MEKRGQAIDRNAAVVPSAASARFCGAYFALSPERLHQKRREMKQRAVNLNCDTEETRKHPVITLWLRL